MCGEKFFNWDYFGRHMLEKYGLGRGVTNSYFRATALGRKDIKRLLAKGCLHTLLLEAAMKKAFQ